MTLATILQDPFRYEAVPAGAYGEWFVAAEALSGRIIEELHVSNETGAIVLASRRGYSNSDPNREKTELFLWGTADQLVAAQEKFRLQSAQDALLDRPEIYWG